MGRRGRKRKWRDYITISKPKTTKCSSGENIHVHTYISKKGRWQRCLSWYDGDRNEMGLKGWAGSKSCCLSSVSRKLCFKDKRKWKMPQKTNGGEFSPAPQRKRRIHLSKQCRAQNTNPSLSDQPCLKKEIRLTVTEKTPSISIRPVHTHMNTQIHTHKPHTWAIILREQNGDRQSSLQLERHTLLSS